jgi:hypothetical protein
MAVLGLNNFSFRAKLHESKREAKKAGQEIASSLGDVVSEKLVQFAGIAAIEQLIEKTVEYGGPHPASVEIPGQIATRFSPPSMQARSSNACPGASQGASFW